MCKVNLNWVLQPEEIGVCRDRDLWSDVTCEQRGYTGKKLHAGPPPHSLNSNRLFSPTGRLPCNGNYPGRCFPEKHSDCQTVYGSSIYCSDGSDVKYCAESVDCEKHGLFRQELDSLSCVMRLRNEYICMYVLGVRTTRLASSSIWFATGTSNAKMGQTRNRFGFKFNSQ